jgi:enamine deaminase RidA (YjgF/YER057c/UK114 family)
MKTTMNTSSRGTGAMPNCEAAVEWLHVDCGTLPVAATVSRFQGSGGVTECHVTVRLTGNSPEPETVLHRAWKHALASAGIDAASTVFRRFFCSDVMNRRPVLLETAREEPGALSVIGQPPLPAAKLALWSQHLSDPAGPNDVSGGPESFSVRRGGLTHHWITGMADPSDHDAFAQTWRVMENHDAWLASHGMTLADHVVRTWWFARDIDADYQGLVDARRGFFTRRGLTARTHYIASTGIAGAPAQANAKLSLDSHAIAGLRAEQVEYLRAPDHLCPTHDYGVTFERATAVSYADRRHVFVSGTASIDDTGRILHEGDVLKQLDRTHENIAALLAKAGANTGDLAVILAYLRDPADGAVIEQALGERFGAVPAVLVHAPVCRPGWLIEIEGLAIVPCSRPELPAF